MNEEADSQVGAPGVGGGLKCCIPYLKEQLVMYKQENTDGRVRVTTEEPKRSGFYM